MSSTNENQGLQYSLRYIIYASETHVHVNPKTNFYITSYMCSYTCSLFCLILVSKCNDSRIPSLKETHNSFKTWPLTLWWISNKTITEVGNITKAATFRSLLYLSYKNILLFFLVTVLFNIFMRKTLTDNFWELHKNMNCVFPLKA